MFVNTDMRAKVWSVKKTEKYIDLRVAESRKGDDGNYEYATWFPRIVGKAYAALKDIKEKDTIVIKKAQLWSRRKQGSDDGSGVLIDFVVYEAEYYQASNSTQTETPSSATSSSKPVAKDAPQQWDSSKTDKDGKPLFNDPGSDRPRPHVPW